MTKKKENAKVGRPAKVIDMELVKSLAGIMCTQQEIASVLGVDMSTLTRNPNFAQAFENGKEKGKMSLRRIQWKHAQTSASMAIWLGKQYLGQRDMVETIEKTENIEIVNDVPKSSGELEVLDSEEFKRKDEATAEEISPNGNANDGDVCD